MPDFDFPFNSFSGAAQRSALGLAATALLILPSLSPSIAGAALQTARSADSLVDNMCFAVHWTYPDTPYGSRYSEVESLLVDLGVRHVRDGLNHRISGLGKKGIRTTVVGDFDNHTNATDSTIRAMRDRIKAINKEGFYIDAVEGPNEPDLFWEIYKKSYKGQGHAQGATGIINGAVAFQKDLYGILKADPATAPIKIIGPALGKTYGYDTGSPLGKGTLTNFVDWGNFHPYPGGGNPFNFPQAYNTIEKYHWQSNQPSVNIDEHPFALDIYSPPFGSKPMAATETGYNTSTAARGLSEKVHAKYMPRLFAEYFRRGIMRTCSYELVDEFKVPSNPEANFGILRQDLSPKPAYTAIQSLIGLLKDPGPGFQSKALDYTFTVTPPAGYGRTQYVRHLPLQKRDGSYYLLLWHEISNNDISVHPSREIQPPDMPVSIAFTTSMQSAALYAYDAAWKLVTTPAVLQDGKITLKVTDRISVLKLIPSAGTLSGGVPSIGLKPGESLREGLSLPAGMQGAKLYDLSGRMLWQGRSRNGVLHPPESVFNYPGLIRVKYLP